ncbi:MAG: GntR family transcriptional regulator [Spirochaetota bacterium]|nr:GntR family transcriptional regulator [Spirochaetota bacterium]
MGNSVETTEKAWQKAYEYIKEKILTIEIPQGATISEVALAEEIGISRTPIREAIKKLEQEGLIVTENRRKRVYILRIEEIKEIFELKYAIEGEMCALAAQRATVSQINEMQKLLDKMQQFQDSEDLENSSDEHHLIHTWLELDNQFHKLIFNMSGNKKAEVIINQLNFQWHRLRLGLLAMEGRLAKSVNEHIALGSAILDKNPEKAKDIMYQHLSKLEKTIEGIMRIFHYPS